MTTWLEIQVISGGTWTAVANTDIEMSTTSGPDGTSIVRVRPTTNNTSATKNHVIVFTNQHGLTATFTASQAYILADFNGDFNEDFFTS